ncbi:MAG: hypothetical protein ACRDL7_15130, partial [Gaiellaceae bacterium]
ESNDIMSSLVKSIPPHLFYTGLQQVIARVGHHDQQTVDVVKSIMKRVLSKYPSQTMWKLSWLRHSHDAERRKIGDDVFRGAQRQLQRQERMKDHDLLVGCRGLFHFLIDLAK